MAADSIGTTFGALLLASWLATGLSGIVYYQSYIFFRSRPSHDSTLFSNLVSFVTYASYCLTSNRGLNIR